MSDGLTLLVLVPLLALFARAWLAALPDDLREMVVFGATSLFATLLAKALIERLWFHRTDGVLARDAQRVDDGIAYFVPLALAVAALGLSVLAVLGLVDPPGMVLGVCSGLPAGVLFPFLREHVHRWWRRFAPTGLRSLAHTRLSLTKAAALSVMVGIVSLALPSADYLDAIFTGVYGLGVILLMAQVDARVVRYMTLVGHEGASLLRHWLPLQLCLLGPLAILLLLAQEPVSATVAAIIAAALPVVTALRIFAYRAVSRLIADWAVALVILAAVYAGLTAPPLGPVVIVAAIIWFARRGAGFRWLLA
ncbi:MAG: hypothetical protein C0472_06430 [Erythrobacter sp.]|nr:hypothetical protein [Erythrobacter sp.]